MTVEEQAKEEAAKYCACGMTNTCVHKNAYINGFISGYKAASEWVSMETLPEKAKPVLLYNGHWIGVGFYDKNHELGMDDEPKWSDETSEYICPEPTHWMPLPTPPLPSPKTTSNDSEV